MPQYGPNNGNVPFTGFTPTLGASSTVPDTTGNASFNGMTQGDRAIASELFSGHNRVMRRLLNVLIGAAAGTTATEARTRETAIVNYNDASGGGGLRAIETINLINRASTAADITNLKAAINRATGSIVYVNDVSGNGAGHIW